MNYAGSSVLETVNEFNTADQSAEGVAVRINLLFGATAMLLASQSIPSWNDLVVWLNEMELQKKNECYRYRP